LLRQEEFAGLFGAEFDSGQAPQLDHLGREEQTRIPVPLGILE
jgi:hypothetical protein